ncbi:hypothetical protein [Sphingomonas sp. URHD0057]|uniref:hypothetical protein n=1 Tax=Sphingomonas sp. URHD0057 TaxID=1380389 RepID=UPI00048C88FF|nr:hypothetical protein [Sphingomonas sp. URHD0057]
MKELFGGCLLAVGILVAGATGLCMSMFFSGPNGWKSLAQAFNFLGVPFLIGIGMVVGGAALIRSGRQDRYRK